MALALAAALDDRVSRHRIARQEDTATWGRLAATARIANPDPRRAALHSLCEQPDCKAKLKPLRASAARAAVAILTVQSLDLLAATRDGVGDADAAVGLLRRAVGWPVGDVWINYDL